MTGFEPNAILRNELERRCSKNPHYSLRAFAKSVGISHTVLSLVLSGKRGLSKKAATKIADELSLDPSERIQLLSNSGRSSSTANKTLNQQFTVVDLDTFAMLGEWHHYAILSLLEIPGAKLTPRYIAKSLGISDIKAKLSIERLKRMNMVAMTADGQWRQTSLPIKVENQISTAATKKFQKQLLEKAVESLEEDAAEIRDFSSITFAMHPSLVSHARQRIRAFRRELCAELEAAMPPTAVYNITVQIFPTSNVNKDQV